MDVELCHISFLEYFKYIMFLHIILNCSQTKIYCTKIWFDSNVVNIQPLVYTLVFILISWYKIQFSESLCLFDNITKILLVCRKLLFSLIHCIDTRNLYDIIKTTKKFYEVAENSYSIWQEVNQKYDAMEHCLNFVELVLNVLVTKKTLWIHSKTFADQNSLSNSKQL